MDSRFRDFAIGNQVAQESPALKSQKEKVSYSIGMDIGANLKKQPIEIDPDLLARGIKDGFSGVKPLSDRGGCPGDDDDSSEGTDGQARRASEDAR